MSQPKGEKVDVKAVRAGHEPLGASPTGLGIFAACFILGMAGLMWLTVGVWHWVMPPESRPAAVVRPPLPNLQPSPRDPVLDYEYMQRLNGAYYQEFASRGWVAADGQIRVPDAIAARVIAESKSPNRGGGR